MMGDHIRTRKDGRWIHAIDCGDETVILLAENGPGPAMATRSYRPAFLAGTEAVEVVTHRERTFPASEIVARAYSRIADPTLAAMFRDSETFAEWCATGRLPAAPLTVTIGAPEATPAPPAPEAPPPPAGPRAADRAKPAARPKRKQVARAAAKRRAPAARAAKKAARKKAPKRMAKARPRRR